MNLTVTLQHAQGASISSVVLGRSARVFARLYDANKRTLGLHVFWTRKDGCIYGVLRFSNGLIGTDGKGFCGTVYAENLTVTLQGQPVKLTLPKGWNTESLVFRPRCVWEVTFCASMTGGTIPQSVLDACASNVTRAVAAYGPLGSVLPPVDETEMGLRYSNIHAQASTVERGDSDLYDRSGENIAQQYKRVGPFLMEGTTNGYAHGGYGIDSCHGWERVAPATAYHAQMHRANMHRQFCDALAQETGNPISIYEWKPQPVGRDLLKGEPGRSSDVELVPFTVGDYEHRKYPVYNAAKRTPSYEAALWEYRPNDLAHIVRVFRHTIPVIEYAQGTPMGECAKFDLLMLAEDARYQQWSDDKREKVAPAYPGEWMPQSLARMLHELPPAGQAHGHARLDRAAGWMAYLGAAVMHYYGKPRTWAEWSRNMTKAILGNQDKFGLSHRDEHPTGFEDPQGRGTQTFHSCILGIGTFALARQLSPNFPLALERMAEAIFLTHEPRPDPYGGNSMGPAHWGKTESAGVDLPAIQWVGAGDPAHVLTFMALMSRNPDARKAEAWLARALKYDGPHASFAARLIDYDKRLERSWTAEMHGALRNFKP